MKQVYQTHFDENHTGPGNCMQAAVASLLELPLDDVPDFVMRVDPWGEMRLFLCAHGLEMFECSPDCTPMGLYFTVGQSTQGYEHIVLARYGRVVHDPNPHGRGLVHVNSVLQLHPFIHHARRYVL